MNSAESVALHGWLRCWNFSNGRDGGGKSGSRVIIWRDRLELTILRAKTVPRERVLQVRQLDLRHPAYRVASRIIPAGLPQTINMVVAHPPGEEYSGAIH
jgi:hypothetical protein